MASVPFRKIEKSPYLGNGLTDRYEIWHADAVDRLDHSDSYEFEIFKVQDDINVTVSVYALNLRIKF